MSIPNILSVFRIVLIPIFIAAYILLPEDQIAIPALLLVLSGATDVVDGFIARHFNQVTQLGKILDPAADKLTLAGVCVALAVKHHQLILLAVIYIVKEALMLTGGLLLMKNGKKLQSSKWFGKLSTLIFYLFMFLVIVFPNLSDVAMYALICVTAVSVVFSLAMYIREYFRLKESGGELKDTNHS